MKEGFARSTLVVLFLTITLISSEAALALSTSNFNCGVWGKRSCELGEWEAFHGGISRCDRGLRCHGGLVKCFAGRGKCYNQEVPPFQRWSNHARTIRDSWAGGAFKQQRELAKYEPLSWTTILSAHNAFNALADSYGFSNQHYSMTVRCADKCKPSMRFCSYLRDYRCNKC
jgi:hypothetical protein